MSMSVLLTILSFVFTVISLCIIILILLRILMITEIFWAIIFAMLGFSVWCIKKIIEKDTENNKLSDEVKKQNEIKGWRKYIEDIRIENICKIQNVMTVIFVVIWLFILFYYN